MSDKDLIKFTNGMLEMAISDTALAELLNTQLKSTVRLEVYKFSLQIFKSDEMEAYQKVRGEIIENFKKEEQAKIDAEREKLKDQGLSKEAIEARLPKMPDLKSDHPDLKELIEAQSGLELRKLKVKNDDLPDSFLPANMVRLSWLINFE